MSFSAHHIDRAWMAIIEDVRSQFADQAWDTWLALVKPVALDGERLIVRVPNYAHSWVSERMLPVMSSSATRVFGRTVRLVLQDQVSTSTQTGSPGKVETAKPIKVASSQLVKRFRFEEFVLGPSNQFAHAAALTVAESPGIAYNPLFICGPPGVGKTHLLHSIGHYAQAHNPSIRLAYVTAEEFLTQFTQSLRARKVERFKSSYRELDLLLVDDVQFLMDKTATMEEFFHTFNSLHNGGAQIVLTSDRVPGDLVDLEKRLQDRFASGLVTEITLPDLPTRMTALRKRLDSQNIELAEPAAIEEIASHVSSSMRAVEAALVRVVAYASLTGRPITCDLSREVLKTLFPKAAGVPGSRDTPRQTETTLKDVLHASAEVFNFSHEELLGRRSERRLSWARNIAIYLARESTPASYPELGRQFGGRNHSTIMNAVKSVKAKIKSDPSAQLDVARVRDLLNNKGINQQGDRVD